MKNKLYKISQVVMCLLLFSQCAECAGGKKEAGYHRSPLSVVVARKVDIEKVTVLLEGGDVNAKNDFGRTRLFEEARNGKKEMVELLLEAGADPNVKDRGGETALHCVALYGNKEVAELLVKNGADPNVKDKEGRTALHLALLSPVGNEKELVKLLLEKGVDVNVRDFKGDTALDIAKRMVHVEIIALFSRYKD